MGPVFTEVTDSTMTVSHESRGNKKWKTKIKMDGTAIAITDGTTSGSHGATLLGTLMEGHILFHGGVMNITGMTETAALTTAAGDGVFEIGVGSTAIAAAADGALATANDNIVGDVNITMSGGDGSGSILTGPHVASVHDGSATACPVYLNASGTAATIDADGTITVTGTIDFIWEHIADD
jgi:hypothetical protein